MSGADILLRLDEESLRRDPEDVFTILEKLGEGSYGCVIKAMHKATGKVVAIKQVPVESDLQEIIKEISMMQQCNWPHVVQYYGSYFKNAELWIIMEYCGAGSVADIMRLRRKTMTESQIACITLDTLKALEYLHSKRKIHRDIKAGNILLTKDGVAKLADFGVAGQLSDTMMKRNTLIGTPFWMAPEVIQEVGYNTQADMWSLGITLIEMSEGKPPLSDVHPMRAIFMIPSAPAPRLNDVNAWTADFQDCVAKCLVKKPEERPNAAKLLQHPFVKNAKMPGVVLGDAIEEAMQILAQKGRFPDDDDDDPAAAAAAGTSGNIGSADSNTIVGGVGSMVVRPAETAAAAAAATSLPDSGSDEEENTGTMIVSGDGDEANGTMKSRSDGDGDNYTPAFMRHFDKRQSDPALKLPLPESLANITDLRAMAVEDLRKRLTDLQPEMEKEIADLRARYQAKRQPIVAAIEAKQKALSMSS